MRKIILLLLLPLLACNPKISKEVSTNSIAKSTTKAMIQPDQALSMISFGSCNDEDRSQDMWQYIVANQPDLWIWLGDNIYADTEDMAVMAEKYNRQKNYPEYQALLRTCPVIGTWDDHDYGKNDAGIEFEKKAESKQLMLDFMDVPQDAPVRTEWDAAYQSFVYGPKGQQVKVILLDARYYRDALVKDPAPDRKYTANPKGDVLGEEQWAWLEEELAQSTAQVHVIGSGIQFIPEEHGWEKWANFPIARKRFFDLMVKTQPDNLVLLSGDRHIAELSQYQPEGLDKPIYELTASSLTHGWSIPKPEANRHRVGEIVYDRNFALLHIDWKGSEATLSFEVKGLKNESFLKETLK